MESIVLSAKKKIKLDEFFSQAKVIADSNIKKILQTSVKSFINIDEDSNGLTNLMGKANVNIVYLDEEDNVQHAEGSCEFLNKQKLNAQLKDAFVNNTCIVDDVTFSGTEVICNLKHNAEIIGVCTYNLPKLSEEEQENLVVNSNEFRTKNLNYALTDNFVVAEEIDSSLGEIDVLDVSANVVLSEVSCSLDKVVLEGILYTQMLYKNAEKVDTLVKEFDFKQEISAERVLPNDIAEAIVEAKNITVSPEQKDNKYSLVYAVDLQAKVFVYEDFETDTILDIFSLKNEIKTTYDFLEVKNYNGMNLSKVEIETKSDISNLIELDDICAVDNANFVLSSLKKEDNIVKIAGQIYTNVLYLAGGQLNSYKNQNDIEFEFETELKGDIELEEIEFIIDGFKVKAGKELEVNYKVNYRINSNTIQTENYVNNYEFLQEKPVDDIGVKVYFSKEGQTLFDIAKILNVRPETILEQNEIDGTFEAGQKIYIYSPINV